MSEWILRDEIIQTIYWTYRPVGINDLEYIHDLSAEDVLRIEEALDRESEDLKGQSYTILTAKDEKVVIAEQCQLDASSVRFFKDFLKREERLGKYHPYAITALSNFAFVLHDGGHVEKARKLWQEVVWRREQVLGDDHPDTLTAKINYFSSLKGKIDEQIQVLRSIYESRLKSLGEEHVQTISAMLQLGTMLTGRPTTLQKANTVGQTATVIQRPKNEMDEGIKLIENVFRLRRKTLSGGDVNLDVLRAEAILAIALLQKGGPEEAEMIQRDVLQKCERVLGDSHERTIESIEHLAKTCSSRGRYAEAKQLLNNAIELRSKALGETRANSKMSEDLLAAVLKEEASSKSTSELPAISWQTVKISRLILSGFNETTKFFLENGANPHTIISAMQSPLFAAASVGDVELVKLLLAYGANPNQNLPGTYTPIGMAIHRGQHSVIPLLLPKMADPTGRGEVRHGGTYLHQAAELSHRECVEKLLEGGLDPNALDRRDLSPLSLAIRRGDIDSLKLLLDRTIHLPVTMGFTLLHRAAMLGHVHLVELIVAKEQSISNRGELGSIHLHTAASEGHVELQHHSLRNLSLNISNRIDLRKTGYEAFVEARDQAGQTALSLASAMGQTGVVKLLAENYGAQIDAKCITGHSPLLAAAANGKMEVVKLLVELGADLSYTCPDGRTILHCALRGGNLDLVEFLLSLDRGLSLKQKDKRGDSGLSYAASGAFIKVVQRVIADYTVLEMDSSTVWSPIHWACRAGNLEIVKILLDAGCKAYTVTTTGSTYPWCPLSIAAFHQNKHISPPDERNVEKDDTNKETYDTLHKMTTPDTKFTKGSRTNWVCDTCLHVIYSPRYDCEVCIVYSLCFMCKETAAQTHPNHSWTIVEN